MKLTCRCLHIFCLLMKPRSPFLLHPAQKHSYRARPPPTCSALMWAVSSSHDANECEHEVHWQQCTLVQLSGSGAGVKECEECVGEGLETFGLQDASTSGSSSVW
jgi:hypothetical protein